LVHRELIVNLAGQHKLPAMYWTHYFPQTGGLMSKFKPTPSRSHRILKGERPADLPVQEPTRYELILNVKTADMLNLAPSTQLLARADDIIE
jgi:putative ABC transport system substrate-binding protein